MELTVTPLAAEHIPFVHEEAAVTSTCDTRPDQRIAPHQDPSGHTSAHNFPAGHC